jgi:hypothetical protein
VSAVERAVGWFLEPAAPGPPRDVAHESVSSAAVLGRPGEAEPLAAALALALRRRDGARAAIVAVHAQAIPEPSMSDGATSALRAGSAATSALRAGSATTSALRAGSATTPARRLADRLDARGLEAYARGRLVWVALPAEPGQAVAAVQRAAAVGAPLVVALTAPRTAALDELLADRDLVVLVVRDPAGPLAAAASEELEARATRRVVAPPLAGAARILAGRLPLPGVRGLLRGDGARVPAVRA